MLIDLFTYTQQTPKGTLSGAEIIQHAAKAGLDGVCITDRESSRDAAALVALGKDAGIFVGIGVQIATVTGWIVGFPPNIDAVLVDEQWRSLNTFSRPQPQEVIDYFVGIGGAAVAASIFDRGELLAMGDQVFGLRDLSAIDVVSPQRKGIENNFSLEASQALHVPGVGGSHALTSVEPIGHAATLFAHPIEDQAGFVQELQGVDYWPILTPSAQQLAESREPRSERRESSDRRGGDRRGPRRDGGGDRRGPRRDGGGDRRGPRRDGGGDRRGPRRDNSGGGDNGDRRPPRRSSDRQRPPRS